MCVSRISGVSQSVKQCSTCSIYADGRRLDTTDWKRAHGLLCLTLWPTVHLRNDPAKHSRSCCTSGPMRLNSVSARSLATRENTARVIPYPRVCGTLRALCACLWSYVPKCYFSLTCTLFQVPSVGTNNAMSYHCLLSSSVLPPQ